MARLFGRVAALTIARPLGAATSDPAGFFNQESNALVIERQRVRFVVEKSLGSTPNKAVIEVFNLAEITRAEVARTPLHVRLDAGYEDDPRRVFVGDLREGSGLSRLEVVDWNTKLECADGIRAHRHARHARSYPAGASVREVLGDVAKSMGLKIPRNVEDAKELLDQFVTGTVASGPSAREMDRLLRPRGLGWSVQDGRLQILREGDVRADEAVVIAQDTGMVGSPEWAAPKKKGGKPAIAFRTLLDPRIAPGGRVRLISRAASGDFKVEKVKHTGDTHGPEWFTDVEAKVL